MGRHARKGLDYFNIDCDQEDNLNFIEAKHGIVGYAVVVKLWRKIYQINGYYCDWTEKNMYLFAKEVGLPIDTLQEIVETCFDEEIFNRSMFGKFHILTSRGVQKRWKKIVIEAKRRETEIEAEYCLIPVLPEETPKTPEKMPNPPESMPQTKENKIEIKEKTVALAMPAPTFFLKKGDTKSDPGWPAVVAVWFEFVTQKFHKPPLFAGEDPRFLKSIMSKLKARAVQKGTAWEEDTGPLVLQKFLAAACMDQWIAKHFILRTLDSQFEQIERISADEKQKRVGDKRNFQVEIDYLYGRFLEGEAKWENYDPACFDWLTQENRINFAQDQMQSLTKKAIHFRCTQLLGSNEAKELRVLAGYEKGNQTYLEEDKINFERILRKMGLLMYFEQQRKKSGSVE